MTTNSDIIHLTGEYWGVKVPLTAYDFKVNNEYGVLWYMIPPLRGYSTEELPEGSWEIVVLAKDITEEIAKGICLGQKIKNAQLRLENIIYPKYDEEFDGEIQCCLTALESYHSLLKSKNLNPETTLIIKKIA